MWEYFLVFVSILILIFICCFAPTTITFEPDMFLAEFQDYGRIPKIIHQTYYDKSRIPKKVFTNIQTFAPQYKHIIYNDKECEKFLSLHFDPKVLQTFRLLKVGAHKADLFRYCVLYVHGGIYLDIKTELISPLSNIIDSRFDLTYLVLNFQKDHIYNGIIATPKNNDIFLDLIDFIVKSGNPPTYHSFCLDFYNRVKTELQVSRLKLGKLYPPPGTPQDSYYIGYNAPRTFYIFEEQCSRNPRDCCDNKLDRHGLCCHVLDKNIKIFKTRYSDYPW